MGRGAPYFVSSFAGNALILFYLFPNRIEEIYALVRSCYSIAGEKLLDLHSIRILPVSALDESPQSWFK